jgi:hypothetical protein
MTYYTLDAARKIAGQMERRDYEQCGDSHFYAADIGSYSRAIGPVPPIPPDWDDIPF